MHQFMENAMNKQIGFQVANDASYRLLERRVA